MKRLVLVAFEAVVLPGALRAQGQLVSGIHRFTADETVGLHNADYGVNSGITAWRPAARDSTETPHLVEPAGRRLFDIGQSLPTRRLQPVAWPWRQRPDHGLVWHRDGAQRLYRCRG